MRFLSMLNDRLNPRGQASAAKIDAERFRNVMSRFATGVTVITAEVRGEIRGMTANAFMSGSLEPPLCVISVAKRARMHEAIVEGGRFGVNMLAHGQEAISTHFAGRPVSDFRPSFINQDGTPLLADACAQIVAQCMTQHDCGDHTLFIGQILHMEADDRPPLLVHARRYASLAYSSGGASVPSVEFW